ncbi:DNA helicase UvrD, partial [Methylococcaceae bacterium CS2]
KTRVLTERIRFILENTKKDSVIALTFTNKAAEEMAERLDNVDAIEDRVWVATIHSVAQRILEQYGHTIGLPAELHIYERDKDRMEVFLQSLRDDNVDIDEYLDVSDSRERRNREGVMQKHMDAFAAIKREILNESEVVEKYPNDSRLWKIYQDYQNALLASGGIDYDDILKYAYKILFLHDWVANIYRAKYKHICVDEAQDLNKIQYEFIKALCGESITSILMVGDPNQMIYGFNGSSSEYLCSFFIDDFKPSVYELKENYRSSKAVIHVANKLKPGSQKESDFALQGVVTVKDQANEIDEANWIVNQIKHLLELKTHKEIEGEITLDKMVVIARNRYV